MQKLAIVGGGISGLSLAYLLQDFYDITVFEKDKFGGKAYTAKVDNYLFEEGVNGFLDNAPLTLKLCDMLGIDTIKANDNSEKRFIYDNKLIELPSSPIGFLTSDIMSFRGKLRMLMEFFISKNCKEESVEEFANRRLGKEFTQKMMVPMLAGIYASTPTITSMNAAFPKLKKIECEYGSLFKGMIKLKRGGNPSGKLRSFEYGISEFIETLKSKTKAKFIKKEITSIADLNGFDKIVLATESFEAAKILGGNIAKLLNKIKYNPVAVVGFDFDDIRPVGFGILTIKEKTLGILMDKYVFPNRRGIRLMIGGARYPDVANLSKKEILDIAKKDIKKMIGLTNPKVEWVKLHKFAIPNYSIGHQKLVEEIMKEAKKIGVILHSNAYRGVSMNDCIKNSFELAEMLKQ